MPNEKFLNTRIINKHDSLANWNSSTLPLKEGEIALAYVETTKPDGHGGSYTIPTYLMKVGVEGKTFSEVEWLAAPASDVYAWAKLENPTINELPANLKKAITDLQTAVGEDGSVADKIKAAVEALDSEETGSGTIVKSVSQVDGKVSVTMGTLSADEIPTLDIDKIDGLQDALDDKVEKVEGKSLIDDTEIERLAGMSDGANKVEKSNTNGNIKIDGAEVVVYTHPATHTASEISDFATEVAKIKVDNAAKADEATKAVQDGNGEVISDTYARKATTLAGYGITDAYTKTEVEEKFTDFIGAYIDDGGTGAIDTLNEIASWIVDDEAGAAKVIADVEDLTDRMGAAEDAIEAIHKHENKGVLDGITAEKVSSWDGAEAAAKSHADGLNTAMNTRVEALEAIDHNHTFVESELNKIADGDVAKWNAAEQNAKNYADDKIEALVNEGQVKSNTDAIADINDETDGILAQAKAYADGLNHEDTTYDIAEDGGLTLNENNEFAIDDSLVWVFDCGGSGVTA